MGRTGVARRLAALAMVAGALLSVPAVPAAAAPVGGTIGPVGQAQAKLLIPGKYKRPPGNHAKQFLGLNPSALRKAKLKAAAGRGAVKPG